MVYSGVNLSVRISVKKKKQLKFMDAVMHAGDS